VPIPQKLSSWWQGRSERERRILTVWALAVAVLALWFGVCAPLMQRIAALERRIPELERQLYRMRAPSAGTGAVNAAARQTGEDLRSVLYGQLAERSLRAELRALSAARVEMRLPEMPIEEAFDTLDFLRRQTGARVAVFGARSDGSPGDPVRIVVELERGS
jgi:type II secretory pathway component PulM